jgi:hypothetical protein
VGVQSVSGQGSMFWFSLPLATSAPAKEQGGVRGPEHEPRES